MLDWINSLLDGSLFAGGVFLVIGIVGAVLLLISVLLDGVFDFFDFGDGPLSLTTIAAFTTIFGFASYGFVGLGLTPQVAGLLGALAGLLGGALAWWLSRVMRNAESNTAVSTAELTGQEAVVVLEVPKGRGFGEIALTRHGERVSLAATAQVRIARGTRVRITQTLSPTSVIVEPMTADQTTNAPETNAPETNDPETN